MTRGTSRALGASVALILIALTAGCTIGAPTAASTPQPTATPNPNAAADAMAVVTPESVQAAIDDLDASVAAAMERTGTPGIAVGVVYDGETVFAEGYGVRDVDSGEPVDPDTVFALASTSKSLGATVVARAIDEGLVSWDTPVSQHLEGFALADPYVTAHVTIADMYAHRSGLYEHAGDELEEIGYDRAAILDRLRSTQLEPFRAVYQYGNFDITAAAESVARAAGEEWEDLSERLLYEPLGMTSTSSRHADLESRENRALGHVVVDGEWVVTDPQRNPDAQSPAGGVSSSIADMTTWLAMLLAAGEHDGETFLTEEALLPAMSPQIITGAPPTPDSRASAYGYGFNISTSVGGLVDISHSGAFRSGTGTIAKMQPGAGLGIVVLSNASANGVVEGLAGRFMEVAQFGQERRDWLAYWTDIFEQLSQPMGELAGQEPPADPEPAGDLASYAGEYANEFFGPATVRVDGDGLRLTLGPTGEWPLEHWSGDVFVFRPTGENATTGTISQATFDGDTLVLEYFDTHGLGSFTR